MDTGILDLAAYSRDAMRLDIHELMDPSLRKPLKECTLDFPHECSLTEGGTKGAWADLIRTHIAEPEPVFTWWSYRSKDWQASNRGRRLDHIWGSENLVDDLHAIEVLSHARSWERPSDHVPVIARFNF